MLRLRGLINKMNDNYKPLKSLPVVMLDFIELPTGEVFQLRGKQEDVFIGVNFEYKKGFELPGSILCRKVLTNKNRVMQTWTTGPEGD